MTLEQLGWDASFAEAFAPYRVQGHSIGRVTCEHRDSYTILSEHGELRGELSGAFRHHAGQRNELPAVGDWAVMTALEQDGLGVIHAILPRKSCFSRKTAGTATEEQIVAANVDTVFIVTGLDANFNLRRIERALILAWESGANPVVVLSKSDLCEELEERTAEVESVALGVPVLVLSAAEGSGLEQLERYTGPGMTVALIGSSGVGKSTLTNKLVGRDVQEVNQVSTSVGKGQHTTTRRELLLLPSGGIVIDTPGMRELGIWNGDQGIRETFEDIESLMENCRFRDCSHEDEPGCAVTAAVAAGQLDPARLRNYRKMLREIEYQATRQDLQAQLRKKEEWKRIHKQVRNMNKR